MRFNQKQSNREDERELLEQSFETKQPQKVSTADTVNANAFFGKKKRDSTMATPRNVREIDSIMCVSLENEDIEDVEETLMAIAAGPLAEASFSFDEFKDEEEEQDKSMEYSGVQFVTGEHSQTTFVQFIPGVNASCSSSPERSVGDCRQLLHRTDPVAVGSEFAFDKDSDLEAQVNQHLLRSTNLVSDEVYRDLMQTDVAPISHRKVDSTNFANAGNGEEKPMQTTRKRCLIVASLFLVTVGLGAALGIMLTRDKGGSGNAATSASCSFCADGSMPTNLAEKNISGSGTCSEYLKRQLMLGTSVSQCEKGQALTWMYCGCPTLPLVNPETTTEGQTSPCTVCPDGVLPTGEGCADFNAAVTLVGTSPFLTCEEAIEMVPDHCSCPNLEPVEQFRRLLRPISGEALEDSTSPQFEALEWLANADPAQLSVDRDSASDIRKRYVAAVLYFSLGGETWTNQHKFLSAAKTCEWKVDDVGIQCDARDEIASIRLPNTSLQGKIPQELRFYSNLGSIYLPSNNLTGTIPEVLSEVQSLAEIDLSDNAFVGPIPPFLFELPLLRVLDLSNNVITGQLDTSIGSAPRLETLLLLGNVLNGRIPAAIGHSTILRSLNIDSNSLTGPVPDFIPYSPMQRLLLGNNSFTGTIPASLGNLRRLEVLSVGDNGLVGTLPDLSGNGGSLSVFELSRNKLFGSLDSLFATAPPPSLTRIRLEGNLLATTIPTSVAHFTSLVELRLGENKISGTIPSSVGNCTALEVLDLADNTLVGALPTELAKLTLLERLNVFGNQLTGSLDFLCSTGQQFDRLVANSCNVNATVACACCTHCCDSTTTLSCNGL